MDGSPNLPPLIFLPLMALGLAFCSLVITIAVLFIRRRRAAAGSSCGHCGYDVRGLPTFTCPECGSDLRHVGIRSGTASANPILLFASAIASSWKRMLLWSIAYLALFAIAMYVSIAFILRHDVFPHSQAILDPASKSYRLTLDQTGQVQHVSGSSGGRSDKIHGKMLVIQLSLPNEPADPNTDFHIDIDTWTSYLYHWTNGVSPTLPPTRFNRGELEKFFKEKQIDTASSAVRAEIDSLMLLVAAVKEIPVHRAASSAKGFAIVSAADKSDIQLTTTAGPPGILFLAFGGSFWFLTMTAIVITRMIKLSYQAELQPSPAAAATAPRASAEPSAHVARTLTVLFSDIKDYTARSAAASRTGAIELVRRHRDLANPNIRNHRGAIVKTIGDALLVTFDSATDAVLAGLDIQSAAASHNATAQDADTIQLRIAVATGEVIVEAGDVYGETVNLASRLQSIAAPGQVVISAATRALINGREVQTEPYGEHQLAGFKLPVQAFVAKPFAAAATLT